MIAAGIHSNVISGFQHASSSLRKPSAEACANGTHTDSDCLVWIKSAGNVLSKINKKKRFQTNSVVVQRISMQRAFLMLSL